MLELVNFTIVTSPAGRYFEKAHFWMIEQYRTNKVDYILFKVLVFSQIYDLQHQTVKYESTVFKLLNILWRIIII